MKSFQLSIRTNIRSEMIDITRRVQEFVNQSGIQNGVCTVFIPHTTAAVTINEDADPDVSRDMLVALDKLIPWQDNYHHQEGNSAAHLKSSLIGVSAQIMIEEGKLILGTWQGIYFCEFDGPRNRKANIYIVD